jgi:hypothetical protein
MVIPPTPDKQTHQSIIDFTFMNLLTTIYYNTTKHSNESALGMLTNPAGYGCSATPNKGTIAETLCPSILSKKPMPGSAQPATVVVPCLYCYSACAKVLNPH